MPGAGSTRQQVAPGSRQQAAGSRQHQAAGSTRQHQAAPGSTRQHQAGAGSSRQQQASAKSSRQQQAVAAAAACAAMAFFIWEEPRLQSTGYVDTYVISIGTKSKAICRRQSKEEAHRVMHMLQQSALTTLPEPKQYLKTEQLPTVVLLPEALLPARKGTGHRAKDQARTQCGVRGVAAKRPSAWVCSIGFLLGLLFTPRKSFSHAHAIKLRWEAKEQFEHRFESAALHFHAEHHGKGRCDGAFGLQRLGQAT